MSPDPVYSRALLLAEQFLAKARLEILELAEDDLDQLRASATALKASAADRTMPGRGAEHIAYLVVASAFNEALSVRRHG